MYIDIVLVFQEITMIVDYCTAAKITENPGKDGSSIADRSMCEAKGEAIFFEIWILLISEQRCKESITQHPPGTITSNQLFLKLNTPMYIGGVIGSDGKSFSKYVSK